MRCITAKIKQVSSLRCIFYVISPKDTRSSCGELAEPSDEPVICNFPFTATERGCKIVILPRGTTEEESSLTDWESRRISLVFSALSWAPAQSCCLYLWIAVLLRFERENRPLVRTGCNFLCGCAAPLLELSWRCQVQHRARLRSAAVTMQMNRTTCSYVKLIHMILL